MKYDEIEFYVDELFRRSSRPPDGEPSFDERLANVEDAILDAYENAMRWHSSQIAGEQGESRGGASSSTWDTSAVPGYEHWSEPPGQPLRHYPAPLSTEERMRIKGWAQAHPEAVEAAIEQSQPLGCGWYAAIGTAVLFALMFMIFWSGG